MPFYDLGFDNRCPVCGSERLMKGKKLYWDLTPETWDIAHEYRCRLCGSSFTVNQLYCNTLRDMNGNRLDDDADVLCPGCGSGSTEFIEHRDSNDGVIHRYGCLDCGRTFRTVSRYEIGPASAFTNDARTTHPENERNENESEKVIGMKDATTEMAIACFKALATEIIRNHFDPEQDEPLYQSYVSEICDEVYIRGVNNRETALGPRMRMLYVPEGLRFQGKEFLESLVRVAVTVAVTEWKSETDDMSWMLGDPASYPTDILAWTMETD